MLAREVLTMVGEVLNSSRGPPYDASGATWLMNFLCRRVCDTGTAATVTGTILHGEVRMVCRLFGGNVMGIAARHSV